MDYSNLSDEELLGMHSRMTGESGAAQVAPDFSQMSDEQLLRAYDGATRVREGDAGAPGADDFGRVDKAGLMKPEDFADKPDLDPVSAGVLNAATEGIDLGDPDEKSFWGIMGQAFGIVGNAMGVKALSKNMQSNLQQIARGKLRQWNGEEVPFDQLDDAELDYAMDKAGVNGWAGFGRRLIGGIGANAMRGDGNLLKQWDDREGVKYADDGNRKRARLAYAQEIARGMLGQQYQMRENAKAELEGRKEGMVSKAARGLLEQGGYTLPFIIDPTHSVMPFLTSASERFNELGADELEVDENGDIVVKADRDSTGSALGKAAVGGALDVAVERIGGELASKAGGLVLKNTLGRIPLMEMVGGKLAKTELGASVAGLARKMNLVGRVTGMQTMPEEVIEEWQNDLFDKGFGLRMRASEKEGTTTGQRMLAATKDFWSGENMKELATSMLLMQVLQSGGAHVADRIGGRRFDAILKDVCGVDGRELKYYTAQEKEAALARWADDMSEEDVRKAFKGGAKAVDGLLKKIEASAGSFDFSTEGATGEGRVQFRVGSWQDRETDTGVKFRAMQDEASGVTIEERQDAQSGKRLYRVVGADGDVLFGRNEQEAFRKANILANQNDTRAAKLGAMRRMGGVTDADVVGDRWSDTLAMFGEKYGADELARLKADPEFRRGHNPLNPSMRWKLADGRSVNLYTLDNIHDQDQMAAYIGHERAIHTGLDAVLGPDKSQFLKAMDGEALEPEERIIWERRMEEEAKARGITVQDIMSGNSPAALKAAEEVYAWTMERVRQAPTMLQSVDASLRKMYRAKFKQELPYNASELYVMANTLRSRMLGPTGRFSYRSAAETDRLAKEEADRAQAEADRMTAENREVLRKNLLGDKPLALPYRTADKSIGSSTSGLTKDEAAQREKFAKATGRTAQKPNAGQAAVPMQDRFTQEVVDTPDPDNVWSQLVWQAKNNAAEIEKHFPGAKPSAPAKKGGEGEVIDVPGTAEDVQLNDKRPSAPLTEDEKALRQMEENDKLMEKYPYLWAYRAMENQQDEFKTAEAVARDLEEDAKNPEREPAEQWAHKQFIVNQMENGDDLDADDVALLGEFGFTPEIMKAQFGYEKGPNGGMVWTGEYEEPGRGAAAPAAKKATRPQGPSRRTQRRAEARKRVEDAKAKAAGAAKAAPAEPAKPTGEPKPAPAAASAEPAKPAPAAKPVQKAAVATPAPGGTTSRATPANAIPMPKSSQAGGQKAETKRKVPVLSKKVEGNSARSYKSAAQAAQGFKDALKNLAAEVGRRLSGRTYKTQQEYETLKDSVLALPSIRSALERMAAVSEWFIGNPRAQIFVRDNIGGKVQHERSLQVETKFRLSNGRREKLSAKPTRGWEIREVIPVLSSVDKLVDECVKGDGAKREIVRDALMEELHRLVNERYASWRRMQDAIRTKPENVEAYNRRADNMNQQARTMGISALMKQAVELGWGTPLLGEFVARGRARFMAVPNEKSDDDIRQWFEDLPRADQILLTRQGRDLNTNQGNVQADSFTDFIFDAADLHGADVLEQIAAMLDDYHKLNAWANDVWSNRKDVRMEEAHEMLWAGMTFDEWREEAKKADTFPAEQVEFAAQEFNQAVEDGMSVVAENAPGLIDYAGTRMQVVGQDKTGWTLQDLATGQVFRVNAKNAQEVQDDAGTEEGAGVRVRDASGEKDARITQDADTGLDDTEEALINEENSDLNWRQADPDYAPRKTLKMFKLFRKYGDGTYGALFIDKALRIVPGNWYLAESPALETMLAQEGAKPQGAFKWGKVYLVKGTNVEPVDKMPTPSMLYNATGDGARYMTVKLGAKGQKLIYNLGLNGSGAVAGYAFRPGWHSTNAPSAAHIGKTFGINEPFAQTGTPNTRAADEVWCEIEIPNDVDYNAEAMDNASFLKDGVTKNRKEAQINHIPENGNYFYRTNSNADEKQDWVITGAIKVIREIPRDEVNRFNRENGFLNDAPRADSREQAVSIREMDEEEVGDANWRIIGESGAMRRYAVPQFKDGADRFATAQDLEDAGASREEIWNKTGWWRGDDNQWRIEVPDFSAEEMDALYNHAIEHEVYDDGLNFGISIHDFLKREKDHGKDVEKVYPGLAQFEREYPEVAGLEIEFRYDMKDHQYGGLVLNRDGSMKYIKLNVNTDWFGSLIHELQHGIQREEGFAKGGSTKVGAGKIKDADLQTIAERVHQAVKSAITWYSRIGERKAVGWCIHYLKNPERIAAHHEKEHRQMLADVAEIAQEYGYKSSLEMLEAVREAQKGVSPFARYRELGGEVEARLAELRSRMSPDERWLEAPWDTQEFMLEREAAGDAPWEIYDKFRDRIDTLKSSVAQQFGVEPNGQMTFGADWRRADYKPSLDAQALADAMGLTATDIQRLSLSPAMMMAFERTAKMLARAGSVNAVEDDIINAFGEGYAKGFKELFGKGRGRVWKVVRTKLQDAMLPLKMLEEKIGVKTEGSAYHAFDFGYGKVDRDWSNFEHDLYDPLKRELVKLGLNTKEGYARFKLALIALHGRDYNRMIAERSPVVRKLLDDPKMPVVMKNAIWDFVNGKVGEDAFKKVLVDMAADSGRFTEQDRADLVRALTGAGGSTAYFAEELRKLAADGLLTTELDKDGHNRVTGGKAAKAVRLVHEMNARTRQRLIESGRLSKRQADLWEKLSPNYVPLRDDMESDRTEMAKFFWGKEGTDEPTYQKSYKDTEFHHATGRNTLADDPLFFSVQQYQTAIQRAADNEARLNLANIVRKQNEGDASRVGKVFRVMGDEERAKVQEKLAVIRKAEEKGEATPEQVALRKELETALEEANNATGSVPTSRVLGADGMIYLMPHVQAIEADNDRVVAFKENGELKFVELGGFTQNLVDEKGALSDTDAALIGRAVKKSSMKKLGDVSKFVRKLTGAFSALRTAWSPAFVVTNFLADNGQAARNIYADFGLGAVGTFENYAFPALKAARNMLNRAEPTNELERFAKEWFDQGGKIGGITTETFRDIEKEFQQALKFLAGGASSLKSPKAVLDFIGKKVGRFNEIVETSTRIAAYATCRKNGYTAAQAASYARDITVNFNRKGEWSPVLNAWYAFSNASIQDIQRSGLAFAGKRGVPLMMGLYAIGYLCAALGFAQDDPEEEKEGKPQYGDTREYRKQNAISLRFGDHTVNFPIRGISRWFMYAGEKSYEAMFGRTSPAKMAGDLVAFAAENGLDPIGLSSTPAQTFTPSIFRPLMELVENQSFSGSQIYRAPMNDYQVRSEMGRKATGTAFKEIARLVNSATGGTRADRGLIDWQPEVYQQVWNGLLGSVGRDIGQAATFVTDLVENGAPRDVRNVPFASRVIGKLDENSARFHEADNRFKAVQQSWKGTDDTDMAARRDIVERHPYMDPKRGDWLAELKDLSNICRNLTSQEMKARGDDDLEAIHELRLKAQYLFLHRIEVDPRTDNPAARLAEREHSRIAEKFVRGRKAEEKREEKKGERARKHL